MKSFKIDISKYPYFSLKHTVLSHGWCNLEPFKWDNDKEILYTIISLDSIAYKLSIKESSPNLIINTTEGAEYIENAKKDFAKKYVDKLHNNNV